MSKSNRDLHFSSEPVETRGSDYRSADSVSAIVAPVENGSFDMGIPLGDGHCSPEEVFFYIGRNRWPHVVVELTTKELRYISLMHY